MRRLSLTLVTVAIVVGLTASVAMSAMRITSISFSTVKTFSSGSTMLQAANKDGLVMTKAAGDRARGGKEQGSCVEPCVGLSLQADGTLAGIGLVEETVVVIEATGIPVVTCTNAGGNSAPGQNPSNVTTTGEQQIGVAQITKNGSASIDVTTGLPDGDIPGSQLGCPNDNWSAEIVGIQFTNATVTVFQNGTLTVQESYSFQGV